MTAGQQNWFARKWMTSYRLNALRTRVRAAIRPCRSTVPVFIFGCQRSGTTMLAELLGLSADLKVYGEGDPEYFQWRGAPRLLDLSQVAAQLARERNRYTLIKPLCETQRAAEILQSLPQAKAIWIFRDYESCVRSHVRYYQQFHDGLSYVRELLALETPCWKNEHLPGGIQAFLRQQSSDCLTLDTAYALYWLARNSLFFNHDLPRGRILLIRYERVLADASSAAADIFEFVGAPYRAAYANIITPQGGGRPHPSQISPPVAERCQRLYADLLAESGHLTGKPQSCPDNGTANRIVRL